MVSSFDMSVPVGGLELSNSMMLADAASGDSVESGAPTAEGSPKPGTTQPSTIIQARIDPLKDQPHSVEAQQTKILGACVLLLVLLLVLLFGFIVMRRVLRHQRAQAALAERRAGLAAAPNHSVNDPWKTAGDRMPVPSEDDQPGNE